MTNATNAADAREIKCSSCNGKGKIAYYAHVDGGLCYTCDGEGFVTLSDATHTPTPARVRDLAAERAYAIAAIARHLEVVKAGDDDRADWTYRMVERAAWLVYTAGRDGFADVATRAAAAFRRAGLDLPAQIEDDAGDTVALGY